MHLKLLAVFALLPLFTPQPVIEAKLPPTATFVEERVAVEVQAEEPVKTHYSPQEEIEKTFGKGTIMLEVARCESGLKHFQNGEVITGIVNSNDKGLFQINTKYHLANSIKMGLDIFTLEGNIAYAKYLYDRNGLRDWEYSASCWRKPI